MFHVAIGSGYTTMVDRFDSLATIAASEIPIRGGRHQPTPASRKPIRFSLAMEALASSS